MKNTLLFLLTLLIAYHGQAQKKSLVSIEDYEKLIREVKEHRAQYLVDLEDFLKKSLEPNTVILDARSKEMYDRKHLKGAIHLNFADFNQASLDSVMAAYEGKKTQILIYCNNNFEDPLTPNLQDRAFVSKMARPSQISLRPGVLQDDPAPKPVFLALNIPTYINLYGYGYQNVYELSELVSVHDKRIRFDGTDVLLPQGKPFN